MSKARDLLSGEEDKQLPENPLVTEDTHQIQKHLLKNFFSGSKNQSGKQKECLKKVEAFINAAQLAIFGLDDEKALVLLETIVEAFYIRMQDEEISYSPDTEFRGDRHSVNKKVKLRDQDISFKEHFKDCLIASIVHNNDDERVKKLIIEQVALEICKEGRVTTNDSEIKKIISEKLQVIGGYLGKEKESFIKDWTGRNTKLVKDILSKMDGSSDAWQSLYKMSFIFQPSTWLVLSPILMLLSVGVSKATEYQETAEFLGGFGGCLGLFYVISQVSPTYRWQQNAISGLQITLKNESIVAIENRISALKFNSKSMRYDWTEESHTTSAFGNHCKAEQLPLMIHTPYMELEQCSVGNGEDKAADREKPPVVIHERAVRAKRRSVQQPEVKEEKPSIDTVDKATERTFRIIGSRPFPYELDQESFDQVLETVDPLLRNAFKSAFDEPRIARNTRQSGFKFVGNITELKLPKREDRMFFKIDESTGKLECTDYNTKGLHRGHAANQRYLHSQRQ